MVSAQVTPLLTVKVAVITWALPGPHSSMGDEVLLKLLEESRSSWM